MAHGASLAVAFVAAVVVGGCRGESPPSRQGPRGAELPAGIAARVGEIPIASSAVTRVASAQSLDVGQARERLVQDALLASGAQRGMEGDSAAVRAAARGVLAGAVLQQLWDSARTEPLTDDELERWTARRWVDVARPEGFRTVHAVAMTAPGDDPELRERARALADRWVAVATEAASLARREPAPARRGGERFRFDPRSLRDPAAKRFIELVRGVDAGGLRHQVERLPVVAADGRVIDLGARTGAMFVPEFTRAAARLERRGDLSSVVETPFGFHVILLLERIPARQLPAALRRAELREDIWKERAQKLHAKLLDRLRADHGVDVATNADALLGLVSAGP